MCTVFLIAQLLTLLYTLTSSFDESFVPLALVTAVGCLVDQWTAPSSDLVDDSVDSPGSDVPWLAALGTLRMVVAKVVWLATMDTESV